MGNIYDEQELTSIERVQLAEDIELPELPEEPLTLAYLQENEEYKLAFNEYKDMMGKFFLPIMTPLVEKGEVNDESKAPPSTKGHKGSSLETTKYTSTNCIQLVIPKYILLNFKKVVPKGTEFVVASVNNSISIEDMRIVGIYSLVVEGSTEGGTSNGSKKSKRSSRASNI